MHIGKWLWLLNKRLYKKLTFLLILALIPALVASYGFLAEEESGILTIALAQKGDDPMAATVMQDLKENTDLLRFVICADAEQAKKMIAENKADAAWIFAENMEAKVYKFVQNPVRRNAFVQIVERESTIPLKLAREKLTGTVFGYCSPVFYLSYIRENVPQLDNVSDAELLEYYGNFAKEIDLFEFSDIEGAADTGEENGANYLLTPVRGMLSLIVVLGAFAAAMYYIHDAQAGTFSLVADRKKAAVEVACQLTATVNLSVVVLLAMAFAGLTGNLARELLVLVLYAITAALFGMTVRRLFGTISAIGTALPLLVVVMLVVCPVFFDLSELRMLQYLFPPTYYIKAETSDWFLLMMCPYTMALWAVYILSGKLLRRS